MSVVPITTTTHSDENHASLDLLIVVDSDSVMTVVSGRMLLKLLREEAGMESMLLTTLQEKDEFKNTLKCKNVIFLLGIKHEMKERQKFRWIVILRGNMQGTPVNDYSVYEMENPLDVPDDTPFQREMIGYGLPLAWLPFVLRFMFGTTGADLKRPMIIDIAKTERSADQINLFNFLFLELGVWAQSEDFVLLVHDGISPEHRQLLRNAKLNGKFVHSYSLSYIRCSTFPWCTSRQSSAMYEEKFVFWFMLDIGLIDVKDNIDKIPAIQIASPIKLQQPTKSTVTLSWEGLAEHTDKSRIIVKQRSNNKAEWSQIGDTLPGSSSAYTATDLQLNQRYQFALIVESYDNESDPTISECFSIEARDSKTGGHPSKVLWVLLMTLVLILDLPAVFLLIAAVTVMVIMTIVIGALTCCQKPKIFQWIWENKPKQIILSLFIMIFLGHLSAAWMIVDVINKGDDTSPFLSYIYITPAVYMLVWTTTANIVSHKFFECEYGVFSLPGRIVDNFRFVDLMVRVHESTEVETVLTVRDIE